MKKIALVIIFFIIIGLVVTNNCYYIHHCRRWDNTPKNCQYVRNDNKCIERNTLFIDMNERQNDWQCYLPPLNVFQCAKDCSCSMIDCTIFFFWVCFFFVWNKMILNTGCLLFLETFEGSNDPFGNSHSLKNEKFLPTKKPTFSLILRCSIFYTAMQHKILYRYAV